MKDPKSVKVLGIIPARGGSTRIPYKNIVEVAGKPLIYYSIREAQKSRLLDAFIVSTDDDKIATVARTHGADVPFKRPGHTARKFSAEIEYQQHALKWLEKNRGWQPEIVVILRPTAPLRPAHVIDEIITFALENPHFSFITTVCPPPFHPYRMSSFDTDGKTLNLIAPDMVSKKDYERWGGYVPTQKLPRVHAHNAIIDVIPAHRIKKGIQSVYEGPFGGIMTHPDYSADIDHPEDLKLTAFLLRHRKGKKK